MTETAVARAVREVGSVIEPILAALAPIGAEFTALAGNRQLRTADLARLDPVIKRELTATAAATGAGVLIAEDLIPGVPRHLQWWMRSGQGLAPLRLNLDPTSPDMYDYLAMDVFTIPKLENRPVVYGPYIDYLGIERYIFSIATPVVAGGRFIGIAATDVPMANLEARLERALRGVGHDAVLVNEERRVIAANTSRWIAGHRLARLPRAGQDGFLVAEQVGHATGWALGLAD